MTTPTTSFSPTNVTHATVTMLNASTTTTTFTFTITMARTTTTGFNHTNVTKKPAALMTVSSTLPFDLTNLTNETFAKSISGSPDSITISTTSIARPSISTNVTYTNVSATTTTTTAPVNLVDNTSATIYC